jgi:REP element-mobilizing transposase RayT
MVYLLTFGCYGQWLPGDERGSVDRSRGQSRGGPIVPSSYLVEESRLIMPYSDVVLSSAEAETVLAAIHEVCGFRGWGLLACHVRSTHVHVVVDLPGEPKGALRDFKAYASRGLNREHEARRHWSRGGNAARLLTQAAIRDAVRYVVEEQGEEMALFVGDYRQG